MLTKYLNMVYEYYWKARKRLSEPFNVYEHWRKTARVLKLDKSALQRLEWIIFYHTKAKQNASLTCRHFAISRKTFYKWFNQFSDANLRTLSDKSRGPVHRRQKQITPLEEQRIIALRKQHIRYGSRKLSVIYQNTHQEKLSSWKVQYTIQKYKLYYKPIKNEKLQKKRKRNQAKKRITELKKQPFPGFLIGLDVITLHLKGVKRYILTAIDSVSKIAFARMYTTKSSKNAADFLNRLFYVLDGSLLNAVHDNGSEFHKEFIKACKELHINQYWTRPRTPQDNSIDERFNRTLKDEFIALGNLTPNIDVFNHNLTEWLVEYVFSRPHQSLGYATPWEFYQKTAKVLPMYSSRTIA